MPDQVEPSARARELLERGLTCFEGLIAPEVVEALTAQMQAQWQRLGRPALFSQEDVWIEDGVHVSPVGMASAGILERVPESANLLLRPELLSLFEELLGPGFELELGAGILSDHTRPVFFWHHHIGGIDAPDMRGRSFPRFTQVERLGCTIYLSPLDDAHGVIDFWPRRLTDPTEPPFEAGRDPWPGSEQLRAPAGSALIIEQSTWHSVSPMTFTGQRAFMGFFLRRKGLAPTVRVDHSIASARKRNPQLARAFGSQP